MIEPDRPSPHHQKATEKQLLAEFSKRDQAMLKERLSQDAYRHFEDALHGKHVPTQDEIAEWKRVSGN